MHILDTVRDHLTDCITVLAIKKKIVIIAELETILSNIRLIKKGNNKDKSSCYTQKSNNNKTTCKGT